jgi:hypothetical protein
MSVEKQMMQIRYLKLKITQIGQMKKFPVQKRVTLTFEVPIYLFNKLWLQKECCCAYFRNNISF